MSQYKDQAEKLRILAERKGVAHPEDLLMFSSLVSSGKTKDNSRGALKKNTNIFFIAGVAALGIILLLGNNKKYEGTIKSLSAHGEGLKRELSLLTVKVKNLENESSQNATRNQELVKQLEYLESLNNGFKEKLNGVEREKADLEKDLSLARQKLQSLEAAAADLKIEMQTEIGKLEDRINQLNNQLAAANSQAAVSRLSQSGIEGKVILINREHAFALVNLGKENNLDRNMQLEVFKDDKLVGELEVIESRQYVSACDIRTPIVNLAIGDKVRLK